MILTSLAFSFALGITPAASSTPSPTPSTNTVPTAAQNLPVLLPAPGPPKLLGSEIIDEGVLVAFGPQGRRYE